ncbi:MAG: hypothetical protein ABSA57_13380 [Candidatus Acidiferrales bacterium]|jgi:hypothetical protein
MAQRERFRRDPAPPRHVERSTIDIVKYNKPLVGLVEKETAIVSFGRERFGDRNLSSTTFAQVLRLFGRKAPWTWSSRWASIL